MIQSQDMLHTFATLSPVMVLKSGLRRLLRMCDLEQNGCPCRLGQLRMAGDYESVMTHIKLIRTYDLVN